MTQKKIKSQKEETSMQLRKSAKLLLHLIVFSVGIHAQNARQYFVAAEGNDKGNGTIAHPFATLEKARTAERKLLQHEKNISVTVYFRGGDYFFKNGVEFDSLDAGTAEYPVTYCAYNNEPVSFSGGVQIATKFATPVKDNTVLERLPATAKDKILQIDLKKMGIKNFG
ncbi:MAG: hypothetical protein ABUT20_40700, partial [Bacteroidota bacterium]